MHSLSDMILTHTGGTSDLNHHLEAKHSAVAKVYNIDDEHVSAVVTDNALNMYVC